MTFKILDLAIHALTVLESYHANSKQFNDEVSEAITALKKVKKYL